MKKIVYSLIFLTIFVSDILAQTNPPRLKISSDNFPIGGFEISSLWPEQVNNSFQWVIDSMKFLGFNTFYQADWHGYLDFSSLMVASPIDKKMMSMYTSTTRFPNADGPSAGTNLLNKYFVGDRFDNTPGSEHRFFLAASQDQRGTSYYAMHSDYERADMNNTSIWKIKQGGYPDPNSLTPGIEFQWMLPTSTSGDLLKLELSSEICNRETSGHECGSLSEFHDGGNSEMEADFIFKFNAGTTTTPLYSINAFIDDAQAPNFPITLAKSDYDNNSVFSTHEFPNKDRYNYKNTDYNNPITLFNFPFDPPLHSTDLPYAVVRLPSIDLGIRNTVDNHDGTFSFGSDMKHKVVFTLTRSDDATNNNIPIFVRGFRLRTKIADDILGNKMATIPWMTGGASQNMDDQIKSGLFYWLANNMNNYSSSNITNITGCGELLPDGYRVLAYIDHLWHDYSYSQWASKKNIFAFLTQNVSQAYMLYRAIYEDENKVVPPTIIAENGFGQYSKRGVGDKVFLLSHPDFTPDPPYFPRDGISKSIRTSEFSELGFTLKSGSSGYAEYTNVMQGQTEPNFDYHAKTWTSPKLLDWTSPDFIDRY